MSSTKPGHASEQLITRRARFMGRRFRMVLGNPTILRTVVPGLLRNHEQRMLLKEMGYFARGLPGRLLAPIQEVMAEFTTEYFLEGPDPQTEKTIRNLADFAVLINRQTTIGFCLQRSLTRYYFLRRAGLLVMVHFGARLDKGEDDLGLAGHAWLTLDDEPYYEDSENWQGYTVIVSFPPDNEKLTP
jgi:hypothetical protein